MNADAANNPLEQSLDGYGEITMTMHLPEPSSPRLWNASRYPRSSAVQMGCAEGTRARSLRVDMLDP